MKHDKLAKAAFAVGAVLAAGAAASGTASAAGPTDALGGLPLGSLTGALPVGDVAGQLASGEITENPLENPTVAGAVHTVEQTGSQLAGQVHQARAGGKGQGNAPMVGGLPVQGLLGGLPVGGLLGGLPLG
ncbi:hypothetical protein ABZV64_24820 [Streptomyces sp. NPDC004959]|uniref:hypothetical protein n=1 Tax=unclassified Streptomyces TaxID=2593676 RepID=UPI0004CB6340|nr:hypothetical protein [Streptomyces sp. NRRL F-5630]